MKNLPFIDPDGPHPTEESLRSTVERARRVQRHRWMAAAGTVWVLLVGVVGYTVLDGEAETEVSTAAGSTTLQGSTTTQGPGSTAATSSTASSTPTTVNPPTTQAPSPTTGEPTSSPFSVNLPESWMVIPGDLYFNLPEHPPYRSLTVASYSFHATPSNRCVVPVTAIAALGPADAFVSIVTGAPTNSFNNPRPPVSAMIPDSGLPEEVKEICLLQGSDARYIEVGFKENGKQYTIHVGLGAEANEAREAEVRRVLESIVIE